MSVRCLADHQKVVFHFQNLSIFLAHAPVVVRQQDGDVFQDRCYVADIELH